MIYIKKHALEGIYIANIHIDNAYVEVFGSISFVISPRNGVYIAIRSDQKLTVFFAKQVRHVISNPSLSNIYIEKHHSRKSSQEIYSIKHYLSRNVHSGLH